MKSIIQPIRNRCYLCGRRNGYGLDPLDKHHVFGGALRSKSERYGLTVYLCHSTCHEFGEGAVHVNGEVNRVLQARVQKKAMEHYGWTVGEWRKHFYKNYLLEGDDVSGKFL